MISRELLDKPAQKPFEFEAAYYPPKYAGIKAYTVDELISGIKRVDGLSIFYHIFHPLFSSHVIPEDMHNDFAVWIRDEIHDSRLAQIISDIEGKEPRTVEDVREDLLKILTENKVSGRASRPFYFVSCNPVIFKTGKVARNLGELIDIIATISMRSIAYHFIFKRVMGYTTKNDFSIWIEENYGLKELADSLSSIDPQTYTDEEKLREDLIRKIEEVIFS
ncbi:DUF5752 family protein [Sulfurisphaera tokodaii]|uniref:Uncharacterized protein n=2 Tax=Sulfurisphaera tokodaii TaxID=111955 RepID=Q975L2_SULTO|nr:DUF5752 family protein [Sulfurisphaera tokodaii]BAB65388.1 hypothetical protein STK_04050 [Sulfurisphaera tokodaii str. 7]HII74916.1 hypothetical protein [Sulfurisphaera tokodaii]